jgi:hypothetical protein
MSALLSSGGQPPVSEAPNLAAATGKDASLSTISSDIPQGVATDPSPDPEAIEEFLRNIGEPVHLCSIVPDGLCRGHWFGGDFGAAVVWAVSENQVGKNIHWTVNSVAAGCHKKPEKDQIIAVRFAHIDIDPPKDGQPFQKSIVEALLAAASIPPAIVVDSGAGIQAFWKVIGSATVEELEEVNSGLIDHFGGDKGTQNADRLMRLPGTVNFPNLKKRQAGRTPVLSKVFSYEQS